MSRKYYLKTTADFIGHLFFLRYHYTILTLVVYYGKNHTLHIWHYYRLHGDMRHDVPSYDKLEHLIHF